MIRRGERWFIALMLQQHPSQPISVYFVISLEPAKLFSTAPLPDCSLNYLQGVVAHNSKIKSQHRNTHQVIMAVVTKIKTGNWSSLENPKCHNCIHQPHWRVTFISMDKALQQLPNLAFILYIIYIAYSANSEWPKTRTSHALDWLFISVTK